jgi:hypothetical protein
MDEPRELLSFDEVIDYIKQRIFAAPEVETWKRRFSATNPVECYTLLRELVNILFIREGVREQISLESGQKPQEDGYELLEYLIREKDILNEEVLFPHSAIELVFIALSSATWKSLVTRNEAVLAFVTRLLSILRDATTSVTEETKKENYFSSYNSQHRTHPLLFTLLPWSEKKNNSAEFSRLNDEYKKVVGNLYISILEFLLARTSLNANDILIDGFSLLYQFLPTSFDVVQFDFSNNLEERDRIVKLLMTAAPDPTHRLDLQRNNLPGTSIFTQALDQPMTLDRDLQIATNIAPLIVFLFQQGGTLHDPETKKILEGSGSGGRGVENFLHQLASFLSTSTSSELFRRLTEEWDRELLWSLLSTRGYSYLYLFALSSVEELDKYQSLPISNVNASDFIGNTYFHRSLQKVRYEPLLLEAFLQRKYSVTPSLLHIWARQENTELIAHFFNRGVSMDEEMGEEKEDNVKEEYKIIFWNAVVDPDRVTGYKFLNQFLQNILKNLDSIRTKNLNSVTYTPTSPSYSPSNLAFPASPSLSPSGPQSSRVSRGAEPMRSKAFYMESDFLKSQMVDDMELEILLQGMKQREEQREEQSIRTLLSIVQFVATQLTAELQNDRNNANALYDALLRGSETSEPFLHLLLQTPPALFRVIFRILLVVPLSLPIVLNPYEQLINFRTLSEESKNNVIQLVRTSNPWWDQPATRTGKVLSQLIDLERDQTVKNLYSLLAYGPIHNGRDRGTSTGAGTYLQAVPTMSYEDETKSVGQQFRVEFQAIYSYAAAGIIPTASAIGFVDEWKYNTDLLSFESFISVIYIALRSNPHLETLHNSMHSSGLFNVDTIVITSLFLYALSKMHIFGLDYQKQEPSQIKLRLEAIMEVFIPYLLRRNSNTHLQQLFRPPLVNRLHNDVIIMVAKKLLLVQRTPGISYFAPELDQRDVNGDTPLHALMRQPQNEIMYGIIGRLIHLYVEFNANMQMRTATGLSYEQMWRVHESASGVRWSDILKSAPPRHVFSSSDTDAITTTSRETVKKIRIMRPGIDTNVSNADFSNADISNIEAVFLPAQECSFCKTSHRKLKYTTNSGIGETQAKYCSKKCFRAHTVISVH